MIIAAPPSGVSSLLGAYCAATGQDMAAVRQDIARRRDRDARQYRAAAAPRPDSRPGPPLSVDLRRLLTEVLAELSDIVIQPHAPLSSLRHHRSMSPVRLDGRRP
jgi:hypothetical protein